MEILWIPLVLYGLAILFAGVVYIYQKRLPKQEIDETVLTQGN